jgi:hypothetical protein
MKRINGYVAVAWQDHRHARMFGPALDPALVHDCLTENNLSTYPDPEQAEACARELRTRTMPQGGFMYMDVYVRRLNIRLMENEADLARHARSTNLVVIGLSEQPAGLMYRNCVLLGRAVPKVPRICDRLAVLNHNGFKCLNGMVDTRHAWKEYRRQSAGMAMIATFRLTRVIPGRRPAARAEP